MNGTALDLKEHVEQSDVVDRYARYDFVYVMLDKRIDHLGDEVKELRNEMRSGFAAVRGEIKELRDEMRSELKDVRGDVKELRNEMLVEIGMTNQRIDALGVQTNQKIDALGVQTNQKIDALGVQTNQKIDTLGLQTTQRIDALSAQMVSMKTWGIGLLITILLVVLAPHIISLFG